VPGFDDGLQTYYPVDKFSCLSAPTGPMELNLEATRGLHVGYCTNIHPGIDLPSIQQNLQTHAVHVAHGVRSSHGIDRLGVGLWIPNRASQELAAGGLAAFREFLDINHLFAYTINGFPYDNFHGEHVKQHV
jgi:hypothetical protein